MLKSWAVIQLLRLDSSLLGFLALFIPSLTRTNELALSLKRSIPVLFICMCAFIANDIDDIDKDRINHPHRPLPTGQLPVAFASALYFICLGIVLFSIKYFVEESVSFWYYGLALASISYGYILDSWPSFKAPYVAITASFPVLIAAVLYQDQSLYVVAASLFMLILGREICMDIYDRPGDLKSLFHQIDSRALAKVAFSIEVTGLLLLLPLVNSVAAAVCMIAISTLLCWAAFALFRFSQFRLAIRLMKAQLFVGLYFLT